MEIFQDCSIAPFQLLLTHSMSLLPCVFKKILTRTFASCCLVCSMNNLECSAGAGRRSTRCVDSKNKKASQIRILHPVRSLKIQESANHQSIKLPVAHRPIKVIFYIRGILPSEAAQGARPRPIACVRQRPHARSNIMRSQCVLKRGQSSGASSSSIPHDRHVSGKSYPPLGY